MYLDNINLKGESVYSVYNSKREAMTIGVPGEEPEAASHTVKSLRNECVDAPYSGHYCHSYTCETHTQGMVLLTVDWASSHHPAQSRHAPADIPRAFSR